MKFSNALSIQNKLIVALLSLSVSGLIFGLYNILEVRELTDLTSKIYYHPYAVSNTVRDIQIKIITMHRDMKDVTLNDNPLELHLLMDKVDVQEKEVLDYYRRLYTLHLGDPLSIRKNEQLFKAWRPIRQEIIDLTLAGEVKKAAAITKGKGARYVKELTDSVKAIISAADGTALNVFKESEKKQKIVVDISYLFFIILAITSLLAIAGIYKDITKPLNSLIALFRGISKDNFVLQEDATSQQLSKRRDEIGVLYESFKKMFGTVQKTYHALEEEKSYSNALIESNAAAIVAINARGRIITYNKKAETLFGFTKEEMIGTYNLPAIVPSIRLETNRERLTGVFHEGEKLISDKTGELSASNKEGRIFPVKVSFGLSLGTQGEIIIANIVDITYEKALRTNLQKQSEELLFLNHSLESRVQEEVLKNKLQLQHNFNQARLAQMGEMISMIAHQWRQPLSAISSITANLQIKLQFLDPSVYDTAVQTMFLYFTEKLQDIDLTVQRLSMTIDDFRNFYKPDKEMEQLDIQETMDKTLKLIEGSLLNNSIEVIKEFHAHQKILIHENEMMQVFLNILKNAEDSFAERPAEDQRITLTAEDIDDGVIIRICNNGAQIPSAILEEIFTPYFSTKDERHGTGLGLYMSKLIVEEHHKGRLQAYNTEQGCCFLIKLFSAPL